MDLALCSLKAVLHPWFFVLPFGRFSPTITLAISKEGIREYALLSSFLIWGPKDILYLSLKIQAREGGIRGLNSNGKN